MRSNPSLWLTAFALLAACAPTDDEPSPGESPDFRDGSYHYVLGYDPHTGEQIRGGAHEIVTFDENGKREPINAANRVSRLHPAMTDSSDYLRYDGTRTEGQTDWDVFASTWWPQSRNGTAQRWQPGANQNYENLSDRDRLSPMEKYDLMFYPGQPRVVPAVSHCRYRDYVDDPVNCERIDHPEITVAGPATQWELQNQGVYQWVEPENWWGHCNGWASYAIAEPLGAPARDIRVRLENDQIVECTDGQTEGCMLWRMADIEALMTELYFSDQATVSGMRCNTMPDQMERDEYGRPVDAACRDLNPGSFHAAVVGFFNRGAQHMVTGEQNARPAFIIDHSYDHEVWNFPVYRYQIIDDVSVTAQEANALVGANGSSYVFNAAAQSFRRVKMAYWMISDDVPVQELLRPADQRNVPQHRVELNYVLELGANDRILGGEWIQDPVVAWGSNSKELHPDFMWMSIGHQGWGEDADDLGGNNDNPFISYSRARALLLCANEPSSCAPAGGGGGGGGNPGLLLDITAEVDRGEILDFDTGVVGPGRYTITLSHDPARPGGDADLFVRVGAQPTTSVWDCRPYLNGSAEQCTIDLTASDTIFIQVRGWAQHINAFRLEVEGPDGEGGGGEAWQGLQEAGSLARNEEHRFQTPELPAGMYRFEITGTGDADLYVRRGLAPTTAQWDCRPYLNGSNETCTVSLTQPSVLHVMVRGYANSSTYSLVGGAQ